MADRSPDQHPPDEPGLEAPHPPDRFGAALSGSDDPQPGPVTTRPTPKLPFAPLQDHIAGGRPRHVGRGFCSWCDGHNRCCLSIEEIAEVLGTSPRQIDRWRRNGVSLRRADELSVILGLVPELVWGLDWDTTD